MDNHCYLIEGGDFTTLQKEISSLIQQNHFQEAEVSTYDLEDSTLSQVLEDVDTYSFLSPRKVIVIRNALFLTTSEVSFSEEEIKHFMKYLKNPSPDVLLIMGVLKCDERKKIVKEIKKMVSLIPVTVTPKAILQECLQGYQLSREAEQRILEYCKEDISKIVCECEKLKMLEYDTRQITVSDIEDVVIKKRPDMDQLAFEFVKHLANRDKGNIFKYYELLKEYHFEPHSMIGLIESQIKLIYQVLLAKRKGMKKDEIAKYLKEHPFRIQKTLEFLPFYQESELREMIHKLHDLDYKIKSGQVDATLGFDIFLLHI